jgi:hypothetical protein
MTQHEDETSAGVDEGELSSAERGALDDAVTGDSSEAEEVLPDATNPPDDDPDSGPEAEAAQRENRLPGE